MEQNSIHGSCLCGAVTFEVEPVFSGFKYCFCSRCRKRSGSLHAANLFTDIKHFRWLSGGDAVQSYCLPGNQYPANCFCQICGSRVPRVSSKGVTVPAGSLDDDPHTTPEHCIYWESRAAWLPLPNTLPKLPGSSKSDSSNI
ncbi:MAG: GFA family protein [Rhodospirillaceae bacterium]